MKPILDKIYKQCEGMFFFRKVHNKINFYALTSQVNYQDLVIFDTKENKTLQILQQLYARDQQAINHLLVEVAVIIQEDDGNAYSYPFKLCISKNEGLFTFAPLQHPSACRVDFVSRGHENGYQQVLDEEMFYYVAESNAIANYAHSEALLIGLLNKLPEVVNKLLEHIPIKKVLAMHFIYYSSLDTCDWCQELLYNMHESLQSSIQNNNSMSNVPIKYIFYSLAPCKKSSYFVYDVIAPYRLYFSKPHQQFFTEDKTPTTIQQYTTAILNLHNPLYESLSICNM